MARNPPFLLVSNSLAGFPEAFPSENPFFLKSSSSGGYFSRLSLHLLFLVIFPFLSYSPLHLLSSKMGVSSGEKILCKMGIRIFPHNQSGLAKSGLAGHTGNPENVLELQRHEQSGFCREDYLLGRGGCSIPLSELPCPEVVRSLQQIGLVKVRVLFRSLPSPLLCYLIWTLPGTVRNPSTYTPDTALTQNPSLFHLFRLLLTD